MKISMHRERVPTPNRPQEAEAPQDILQDQIARFDHILTTSDTWHISPSQQFRLLIGSFGFDESAHCYAYVQAAKRPATYDCLIGVQQMVDDQICAKAVFFKTGAKLQNGTHILDDVDKDCLVFMHDLVTNTYGDATLYTWAGRTRFVSYSHGMRAARIISHAYYR